MREVAIGLLAFAVLIGIGTVIFRRGLLDYAKALAPGARVAVARRHFWAAGATGAVWLPPDDVKRLAHEWSGVARTIETSGRKRVSYWVVFDAPQPYPDGDGPFIAAELPVEALRPARTAGAAAIKRTEYFAPGQLYFSWFENKKTGLRVEFKAKRKQERGGQRDAGVAGVVPDDGSEAPPR